MPPLSATDAIAPAWQHTRRLLLGPRNPRLFFKIAAVAFFAEVANISFSFSLAPPRITVAAICRRSPQRSLPSSLFASSSASSSERCFFYLSSRLQFTIFHIVLRSET